MRRRFAGSLKLTCKRDLQSEGHNAERTKIALRDSRAHCVAASNSRFLTRPKAAVRNDKFAEMVGQITSAADHTGSGVPMVVLGGSDDGATGAAGARGLAAIGCRRL
jgi:hypothetical protein